MADAVRQALADVYVEACREEVEALKPGNVHVFADGHGMVVQQFLTSADVSASPLTTSGWPVGRRVLEAVRATRLAVGVNTNLGIILLCAPLLAAAERCLAGGKTSLRTQLQTLLRSFDAHDARDVFAAIAHASPGGLAEADNDVRKPPRIGLFEAMRQASQRDRIAWQYTRDYGDVFSIGLAEFDDAIARGESGMWPCIAAYLGFLAAFPDSHIERKFGAAAAEGTWRKASLLREQLMQETSESNRIALLLAFDRELKTGNINPGTSADLTVASLLVRKLRDSLLIPIDDA